MLCGVFCGAIRHKKLQISGLQEVILIAVRAKAGNHPQRQV